MPSRHSLFWQLAGLLVGFCLLIIWLSWAWGQRIEENNYGLSREAQTQLQRYGAQAEQAWLEGGRTGVDRWLDAMSHRENSWMTVVGPDLQALGSEPLAPAQARNLTFLRGLDWPVSKRGHGILPFMRVPFVQQPDAGMLVIRLPKRFLPTGTPVAIQVLIYGLVPGLLAFLLGVGLHRLLIAPLAGLREQANALRDNRYGVRAASGIGHRRDELGELGRAFDHMAERLQSNVAMQRQLLRDLSHELRTPLSRLRVACESELAAAEMRRRVSREVDGMQRLVDDTLQLVWHDHERPDWPLESIDVPALWDILVEDACFESGWPVQQIQCQLSPQCRVVGHLNGLAQALENVLRNAIRHSAPQGIISLNGERADEDWHLWVQDAGPGIVDTELERIFDPFIRLDGSRPGDGGFGLGLSIARHCIERQNGHIWAENRQEGLRVHVALKAQ